MRCWPCKQNPTTSVKGVGTGLTPWPSFKSYDFSMDIHYYITQRASVTSENKNLLSWFITRIFQRFGRVGKISPSMSSENFPNLLSSLIRAGHSKNTYWREETRSMPALKVNQRWRISPWGWMTWPMSQIWISPFQHQAAFQIIGATWKECRLLCLFQW